VWNYADTAQGGRATACLTTDGVLLRAEGAGWGQSGRMEATEVVYGPHDPARFRPPVGYQTMQIPGMPPGVPPSPPHR